MAECAPPLVTERLGWASLRVHALFDVATLNYAIQKVSITDPVTNTWALARSYVTTARNAAR